MKNKRPLKFRRLSPRIELAGQDGRRVRLVIYLQDEEYNWHRLKVKVPRRLFKVF